MSTQIRKSDLQRIVREEYVRVLLENSGHKVTNARVRLLAEKMETGEIDEALGDWLKAIGGVAGEKVKGAGQAIAKKAGEIGGEIKAKASAIERARLEKQEAERLQKNAAAVEKVTSELAGQIITAEENYKSAIIALKQKAKEMLEDNGYKESENDETDLVTMSNSVFETAAEEAKKKKRVRKPSKKKPQAGVPFDPTLGKFRRSA